MNNVSDAVAQADLDSYTLDAHAFAEGRYNVLQVFRSLPGDHVNGGSHWQLARVHAKSPVTIYDNSVDGSRHGRLSAATLITLLRRNLVTTDTYQDIRVPADNESVLKTWGEAVYAHVVCTLYPRAVVTDAPFQMAEMDAKRFWDAHPETREASLFRLQAATDHQLANPETANPFLFDTFKTQRTSTK